MTLKNNRNGRGGPSSPEGKKRSSQNSTTHACTAVTRLREIIGERKYDKVLAGFREALAPVGALDEALVEQIAQAYLKGNLSFAFVQAAGLAQARACDELGITAREGVDGALSKILGSPRVESGQRYGKEATSALQRSLLLLRKLQEERLKSATIEVGDRQPAVTGPGRPIEDLKGRLEDEEAVQDLLWELFSASCGHDADEELPVNWRSILESALDETFIKSTGIGRDSALLLAGQVIIDPETPVAALCETAGIHRRGTAIKLLRLVRDSAETTRDWLIESLKGFLGVS